MSTEEFPAELDATSLRLAGAATSVDEALAALVAALDTWLPRSAGDVLAAWSSRDALRGRPVRWANGSKDGTAAGVDSSGALIVDTAGGRITLDAGEVHLLR